jgi:hypothetical protein
MTLIEYKGNYWLTNSQMIKYQGMLCENPHIQLEIKTLNPATLLPVDPGPPEHDCLEVMHEVSSSQPDLTDQQIDNLDVDYFTDGSSFAGYAVVTLDSITEAHPLLVGTSAQKAKLVALTHTPACFRSMSKHLN